MSDVVIRLKHQTYIHVLDNNTNVTLCYEGPLIFTRKDHEKVLFDPRPFVAIPPRHYCKIRNPCVRAEDGTPLKDGHGQVRLRFGDEEIRFEQDPFPLMPGEVLVQEQNTGGVVKLTVVPKNVALRLCCVRDFTDGTITRRAGDEWMFEGPETYVPRIEVNVVQKVKTQIIKANSALRLRARAKFVDRRGVHREVGDEWLVRTEGAYMPSVEEEVVGFVEAKILTEKEALHLEAVKSFTDCFGKQRQAGEQWLITYKDAATHIPDVYEKVAATVPVTTLSNRQFCVVLDPVGDDGKNRFGEMVIRRGEDSFFLQPGERLRNSVENVMVLANDEAVLVSALETFKDGDITRKPGEKWLIRGPTEYVPPVQVNVMERRQAIPLDENEGIYVRDEKTGQVRAVGRQAYLLSENESLWSKKLPAIVEELLERPRGTKNTMSTTDTVKTNTRDRTQVVRFSVQHNAAVQLFDYKTKKARIVFGPDLVLLSPDEEFTVLSLSGDKPKIPNVIKSLQMFLGPDFSSDHVIVETSDHARLLLKLSYNWRMEVDRTNPESAARIFSVPDFIGDMCKAVASRVRGAVAAEDFDTFHRHSARIIRAAVFGVDSEGKINSKFKFAANDLVITNIDIQSVEPTDTKTRDSLQQSVQLAIEITTKSQEATARHDNERKDQEAKGKLERQKILDKIEAEKAKKHWLTLQAESEVIQACGQSIAEAKARAEASLIEAESESKQAELRAEAFKIAAETELAQLKARQLEELEFKKRLNELELHKARQLADIEANKLSQIMEAIGPETLVAIAEAGPEMQAKLLEGLGLKGYLITDGNSPINLFNTAQGMMGVPGH